MALPALLDPPGILLAPPFPGASAHVPPLRTGWEAFDALALVKPGHVTLLDAGSPEAHHLLLDVLAKGVRPEQGAVVVVSRLEGRIAGADLPEARKRLQGELRALARLAHQTHVPVVVANRRQAEGSRHPLRRLLEQGVDEVVLLRAAPQGRLVLRAPRRGLAVLLDPPRLT